MLDDLDPRSAVPLYQQIAVRVKAAVATGELRDGDLLPSVRELAGRLRINPATVTQAYRTLDEEGFVELRHGSGTFVRGVSTEIKSRERTTQARRLVQQMLAEAAHLGLSREELQHVIRTEMEERPS